MKKIFSIVVLTIMAVSAFAEDYKVFEKKNIDLAQVKNREVLYSGGYREYTKNISEIQKSFVQNGAYGATQGVSTMSSALAKGFYGEALKGAGAGIGIGLAIAGIQYIIDESAEEKVFIKLETLTMLDESKILNYKIIVVKNTVSLSESDIKKILN